MAALVVVSSGVATVVTKPVTKGLGHGAIYQRPLDQRSCYGSQASVKLAAHKCTVIPQLKRASSTTPMAVSTDSRALYIASGGGVLVLNRDASGRISYNSCAVLTGPCGVYENDEGATVSEVDIGPGGRQLYVLIDRAQEAGTEIHAMAIGADHRLSPDPSCLALIPTQSPGLTISNPRNCRVDTGDDRIGGVGLVLTPNGRFAYLTSTSSRTTVSNIIEMARDSNGSLNPMPGCVSGDGGRGSVANQCETILPRAQSGEQILNLLQLAATPDSAGLVVRGEDTEIDAVGRFLVRFRIEADGHLTRSRSHSACVNATGTSGCVRSTALLADMTSMALARNRVYVGTSRQHERTDPDIFDSNILGYQLAGDGGLSLPTGSGGCAGHVTGAGKRIRSLGKCSLGREAMRHPYVVFAGPRGDSVYVLGFLYGDDRGIAPFKLGSGGAPTPVKGPSGCLLDGFYFVREKTPCNRVFATGTLRDAELTFTPAPDGRAAYVLAQPPASDALRLTVLQRVP